MEERVHGVEEQLQRMKDGRLYVGAGEEIEALQREYLERLYDFNASRPSELEKRRELLESLFAEIGEGAYIEPPLRANWGGKNVHMGKNVYANFNLTLVDDSDIYIGDYTMIGPNVTISAAGHPILPELREKAFQYNIPVHIGRNVWIGANAVIMPGVTIGENSVIGAGSVVTKDIPADVIAVGNPCKVLRPIGERDREFYFRDKKIEL